MGSAVDPVRRFQQHNENAVKATRGKGPWRLAITIGFQTETLARKAEYHLKKQKSRKMVEAAISGCFVWPQSLVRP